MLLPLQGALLIAIIPRAMPWARSFWAFSPFLNHLRNFNSEPLPRSSLDYFRFRLKKSCMTALQSFSSTPAVMVALGCSAWGAKREKPRFSSPQP